MKHQPAAEAVTPVETEQQQEARPASAPLAGWERNAHRFASARSTSARSSAGRTVVSRRSNQPTASASPTAVPLLPIREGSVLNAPVRPFEPRPVVVATKDLALRHSAWLDSERCGQLMQGTAVTVLEETKLSVAMGKRVVRALVICELGDGTPQSDRKLGWITSWKNGAANLVAEGVAVQGDPGDAPPMCEPSHRSSPSSQRTWTAANNGSFTSSSTRTMGWHSNRSDLESRAARSARRRLSRQRLVVPQRGAPLVVGLGCKDDERAIE